jgi:hypothetical protein
MNMTNQELFAMTQEEMRIKNAHDLMIETVEEFKYLPYSDRYKIARTVAITFKRLMDVKQ